MNKKTLLLATVLMLPFTAVLADPVEDGPHGHSPKRLEKALALTPDQTTKVEAIFKEEHEKFRALHEESHNRIKEVLTPDQVAKWEEIIKQHKEKRHHHKE
jgi:Spy/CpxP family protein refolding chaperone